LVIVSLPALHLTVETGPTGTFDQKVTLRNSGTASVSLIGAAGASNLTAGHTADVGPNSYPGDGSHDTTLLLQTLDHQEAVVHCWFPGAGLGTVDTWCFATGTG